MIRLALFTPLVFSLLQLIGLTVSANEVPKKLLGDWSLSLESNEPAWMSIFEKEGKTAVAMRVYVGPEGPYEIDRVAEGRIHFSLKPQRKHNARGIVIRSKVEVGMQAGKLNGTIIRKANDGSESESIQFTGKKMPPMPAVPPDLTKVEFGKRIELFNGKDLAGWRTHERDKINGWSVKDGLLVNTTPKTDFSATGAYANLRTDAEFKDFRLHVEFLVEKKRNSGIYLRGMYEAQVVDRDSPMQGIQGVGAIFGRIKPTVNAGKQGGQWQFYDITLVDRHITVVLNGTKVIDNKPVIGPTAGAIQTDVTSAGPIYLQGDHTNVKYRNLFLEPVIEKMGVTKPSQ